MSTMLLYKKIIILHTSSGLFGGLYDSIENIIYEQNLSFNKNINNILYKWDISPGGIGFDIADYIHNKNDLITFADLIRKGLNRLYEKIPLLEQFKKDNLENFYQELLKLQEAFPD